MSTRVDLLDRLAREEHTGRNRCWPCTAVNAVLLAAAAALVAVLSPLAAAAVLAAGGATIWLRGYLVPYTPQFAPRLVAALGLEGLFHDRGTAGPADRDRRRGGVGDGDEREREREHEHEYGVVADVDDERRAAIAEALLDAGVLRADDEQFHLDTGFETAWWERIATLRERSDAGLAATLRDRLPWAAAVEAVGEGDDREVRIDGAGAGDTTVGSAWVSRPAAVASLAAIEVLDDRGVLDPAGRALAADGLRLFLKRCPVCESGLVEEPVGSCCGGVFHEAGDPYEVRVCPDCGAPVATLD